MSPRLLTAILATIAALWTGTASLAGDDAAAISLGLQEAGTASWEIAAMQAAEIDRAHRITVTVRGVADSRAAQVALLAQEVDAILSDFVWVSGQREQGSDVTFVPHSLLVGGLIANPAGPIGTVTDLKGRTFAVAGGPLDKSYVVLQAYYHNLTGNTLTDDAHATFGAPPLVNELLIAGHADAALNFWHFNVRSMHAGMRQVISVREMLAQLGVMQPPPMLGWVFSERRAQQIAEPLQRFLAASRATKELLLTDEAIWTTIRPAMRGAETDDALFAALRDAYRAGIITGTATPADIQAAADTYSLLARHGGIENAVAGSQMAPGTFWPGPPAP